MAEGMARWPETLITSELLKQLHREFFVTHGEHPTRVIVPRDARTEFCNALGVDYSEVTFTKLFGCAIYFDSSATHLAFASTVRDEREEQRREAVLAQSRQELNRAAGRGGYSPWQSRSAAPSQPPKDNHTSAPVPELPTPIKGRRRLARGDDLVKPEE